MRALADGGDDPRQVKLGDIASKELTMLSPDDSVEEAVARMRDKAIRRIPVCEDGHPVGMVSIGDLAIEGTRTRLWRTSAPPPPTPECSERVVG